MQLERADCVWHKGIPVTTVARTIIDLATVVRREQLETVLDNALSYRRVGLGSLARRLDALGTRGRKGAACLAQLIEARRDGVARPSTGFQRRLQRVLAEAGLAIEADSFRHHSSLTAWSRDRVRNSELVALGWRILP